MKAENQVCTLAQAKVLKELGIVQVSEYHHLCIGYWGDGKGNYPAKYVLAHHNSAQGHVESYSAFSVAELSIMLWAYAETYVTKNDKWACGEVLEANTEFDTQAEASAARLIYLLLGKSEIKIEEANKRLLEN